MQRLLKKRLNPVIDACLDIWQKQATSSVGGRPPLLGGGTELEQVPSYLQYIHTISQNREQYEARDVGHYRGHHGYDHKGRKKVEIFRDDKDYKDGRKKVAKASAFLVGLATRAL